VTLFGSSEREISDVETAKSLLGLMDALDDHDDMQNVSANVTIPERTMAAIGASSA
jgi:transcriptional/translational regulatory protein YebC/TACO1